MKNNIFSLFICVLTSLLSFSVMANTCEIPAQLQNLSCVGRFKADSMSDIETYKNTYLQEGVVAKDLVIRFDLDVEDLSISSPCKIIFNANRSIKSTGNICLNAKNGLHINKYANIEVKNLALYSENKIAIRPNATILGDNLTMISTGDSPESRVHIRHSSTVDLKTLNMEASRRATLGHSSQYTVSDSINLKTTGASNVQNQEFVAIWKNTSISTNELNFNSHRQIKLSTGLAITSDTLSLIAPQCKMAKTVTGVAAESCQSLITPKLKVSAKIITADESVEFNASRTTALNEIKSFSYLIDNVFYENVGDRYTHQFKNPGIYSALLVIEDVLGNVVTAKKRIKVLEKQNLGELAAHFYYRQSDDNEVVAYFVPRLGSYEVSSAYYEYSDGSRVDIPHFFHLYETDLAINNDREEITLVINTTDGKVVKKTHVIELDNLSPVVNMDIYHKDVKTFIFDIVNSFDPAMSDDVNGEIDYVEIDFGDGSSEEIDFTDDTFLGFIEHEYSKTGVFTGSLTFVSYETGSSVKEFQVNTESSIDQARMVRFSTVLTDQAEHVRFQFNKSLFVNTELESVLWQYGDGTTSTTTDFEHVHFYDAGVYDVSLTAFFTDKTMQTMTQRIVVQADGPPVVAILDCWEEDTLQAGCWVAVLDKYEDMKSANIDWGDGNTTSINLTDAGYTSNDFTHEYGSEGEYQIKVDIETFRGATGSRSQSLLLEGDNGGGNGGENQIPVAVLNCYSNTPFTVVCDGGASYDPDGDIDSYTFSYQDQTISNGDGSISFVADDSGPLEVSLKVADNEGEFSELVETTVNVKENIPPVASFICNTDNPRSLSCDGSNSEDVDGQIELFEFYINNERQNNNLSEFTLAGLTAGNYEVKLVVYDEFNEASEPSIQNVTVRDYATPVAGLTCESNSRYSLTCDASSSSISEGYISTYIFNVDGTEYVQNDPSLDLDLGYAGLANISLSVMSNYGINSEAAFITIGVIDNTLPTFEFSCITELLDISCSVTSVDDDDGDDISYSWIIDGSEVSTSNTSSYKFSEKGSYSVELSIRDGYGESLKSLVYDLSDDPKDLIVPVLACRKMFGKIVNCSSYGTTGNDVAITWFINGQQYAVEGISFDYEFADYGIHKVKAVYKNQFFEKTLETDLDIQYIVSELEFGFSLNEDGDILLNGESSLESGGSLYSYKWTIVETGEEFSSVLPSATFRYDVIQGKEVQFSALTELDELITVSKVVDVSEFNRPPVAVANYNQPRGKASREVLFSADGSIDHDGEVVSYSWDIDGQSFTGSDVTVNFSEGGTKTYVLTITDNKGLVSSENGSLYIEALRLGYVEDSYYQLEVSNFTFENYLPLETPIVKIKDIETIAGKNDRIGYTFLVPPITEEGKVDVSVSVDGLMASKAINVFPTLNSENPDEDLPRLVDDMIQESEKYFTDSVEDQEYIQTLKLFAPNIKEFLTSVEDNETKKMAASLMYNHIQKDKLRELSSRSNYQLPMLLRNMLQQNVYASLTDEQVLSSAESCRFSLNANLLATVATDASMITAGTFIASTTLSSSLAASLYSAGYLAATTTLVTSTAVVAIPFVIIGGIAAHKHLQTTLTKCVSNVRFPYFTDSTLYTVDLSNLPVDEAGNKFIYSGLKEKAGFTLRGYSYFDYKNRYGADINVHPLYKKMEEAITFTRFKLEDLSNITNPLVTHISNHSDKVLTAAKISSGVLSLQSKVIESGMEEQTKNLVQSLDVNSGHEDINITGEKLVKISDYTNDAKINFDGIHLSGTIGLDQVYVASLAVQSSKNDVFLDSTTTRIGDDVNIVPLCGSQKMIKISDRFKSFRSIDSKVEGTVNIRGDVLVCDGAQVEGIVTLGSNHNTSSKTIIKGDNTHISSYPTGERIDNGNQIFVGSGVTLIDSTIKLENTSNDERINVDISTVREESLISISNSNLRYTIDESTGSGIGYNIWVFAPKASISISNTDALNLNGGIQLVEEKPISFNISGSLSRRSFLENVSLDLSARNSKGNYNIISSTFKNLTLTDEATLENPEEIPSFDVLVENSTIENTPTEGLTARPSFYLHTRGQANKIINSNLKDVYISEKYHFENATNISNIGYVHATELKVIDADNVTNIKVGGDILSLSNVSNISNVRGDNAKNSKFEDVHDLSDLIFHGNVNIVNSSEIRNVTVDNSFIANTTNMSGGRYRDTNIIKSSDYVDNFITNCQYINDAIITNSTVENCEYGTVYVSNVTITDSEVSGLKIEGFPEVNIINDSSIDGSLTIREGSVTIDNSIVIGEFDEDTELQSSVIENSTILDSAIYNSKIVRSEVTESSISTDSSVIDSIVANGSSLNFSSVSNISNIDDTILTHVNTENIEASFGSEIVLTPISSIGYRARIIASEVFASESLNIGDDLGLKNNSYISGDVSLGNKVTVDNSQVRDRVSVGSDVTISNLSAVYGDATLYNEATVNASQVSGKATVQSRSKILSGSSVGGQATVLSGSTVSGSNIYGTATVGTKYSKTCDGEDDTDPDDPCMTINP